MIPIININLIALYLLRNLLKYKIGIVIIAPISTGNKGNINIGKLNTEIVNHFIDKVLVGNYNEKTNSRNILIIWNFII